MTQLIIVAEGVEIRDTRQGYDLRQLLKAEADLVRGKTATYTYPKGAGRTATFEIRLVYTMTEFAAALDTPDAIVVYSGHSRYGQGPAFAPAGTPHIPDKTKFPVNPWGVHYRMGYDATDTECMSDLLEHSVMPVEYDLISAPSTAFLPAALRTAAAKAKAVQRARKGKKVKPATHCATPGAWRTFDQCFPVLAGTATVRGDQPLKGRHYYARQPGARKPKTPEDEFLTAVTVGSGDLNLVSLKCKVLFMASCSSKDHYLQPLVKRRKDAKSSCKFYLTGFVNTASHARNFLQLLFKGHDPTSKTGAKAVVKGLNAAKDAGLVGFH